MKSSEQVRNDNLQSILQQGWEYATIPGLLYGANELIAHFTLL
jgi:hypothetical protein